LYKKHQLIRNQTIKLDLVEKLSKIEQIAQTQIYLLITHLEKTLACTEK
jgi:hypothetical protein